MKRILLLSLFCLPSWGAWSYSYPLTYDHTQVGAGDSSNFPALVAFNASAMKDAAHGGDAQSSAGADILFYSDSGLTAQIASQAIYYDNINGIGWFRVKIGTLSHSSNGTIYMAVGNASPPPRTAGVWDASTVAMWPFSNGTTLSMADVATGTYTMTGNAAAAAGKVDGGAAVSRSYMGGTTTDAGFLTGNSPLTLSAWVNFTSSSLQIMEWGTPGSGTGVQWSLDIDPGEVPITGGPTPIWPRYAFSNGVWYHVAVQFDGTYLTVFVNGSIIGGPSAFSLNTVPGGAIYLTPWAGNGVVNALRVSSVARGADWDKAEYNNENAPGNTGSPGFWTFGARTPLAIARKRTIVVQ